MKLSTMFFGSGVRETPSTRQITCLRHVILGLNFTFQIICTIYSTAYGLASRASVPCCRGAPSVAVFLRLANYSNLEHLE